MHLSIKGEYRYRTRVKILWFWVVEPWKKIPIDYSVPFALPSEKVTFAPVKGVPIQFSAEIGESVATVSLDLMGQAVWERDYPIPAGLTQHITAEPIKGCILDITASLEA